MERLISAFGSGRAVILYGTGPSMEIGLPSWRELTKRLIDAISKELNNPLASVYEDLRAERFSKAIGDAERLLNSSGKDGREYIARLLADVLADTGRQGKLYSLMAQLPVRLFITTNFESVFERHLKDQRFTPESYTNLRESLEALNPASFDKSILYMHGSLNYGGQLIISDSDFSRILKADEFQPLRKIIESHLINSAVVMIGYSLSDPDLKSAASNVAKIIRRRHPVVALLADADRKKVSQFATEYNVEVISYPPDSGHDLLCAMLSTVLTWLKAPQVTPVRDEASLNAAQYLYVYDATKAADTPTIVAALKSILLVVIKNAPSGVLHEPLSKSLRDLVGADPREDLLERALSECEKESLIRKLDGGLELTEDGNRLVEVSNNKYQRLWRNLAEQAQAKVGTEQDLLPVLQGVLVGLFSRRAAEAVTLSIYHHPIETSSKSLFELIAQPSAAIAETSVRFRFIEYVIGLLRRPNTTQRTIIEHLGRSLFCAHALRLDRDANRAFQALVSGKSIILDSNLLIPLAARHSPKNEAISSLLKAAKENGLSLITTYGFAREVLIHVDWARSLVEEYRDDEATILAAARGFGIYDGNEFLNGMILRGNISGQRTGIHGYIKECFGTTMPDMSVLTSLLNREWGISVVSSRDAEECSKAYNEIQSATERYILGNPPVGKKEGRIHTEAEAYALLHEWPRLSSARDYPQDAMFLSSGGYLNKVAKEGPYPLGRNVTTTPYALGAFISAYLNPAAVHDFGTIIRAEFFNAASDFIEESQLEQYFSGVITEADRAYEEVLRPRLEKLGDELIPEGLPETLSDVSAVQRPEIVRSLATAIADLTNVEEIRRLRQVLHEAKQRALQSDMRADKAEALLNKRRKGQARYERAHARRRGKK